MPKIPAKDAPGFSPCSRNLLAHVFLRLLPSQAMRLLISCVLMLTAFTAAFGQSANSSAALSADPQALLNAAAPFYNFPAPDTKPFHLKADYQLYDAEGKPTDKGTFEYWWASPTVHRSSWTRAGAERTEWSTSDGPIYVKASGAPLHFFERTMEKILFSPLPRAKLQDPARTSLALKLLPPKKPDLACLVASRPTSKKSSRKAEDADTQSIYCFDLTVTGLRLAQSYHLTDRYGALIKTQGRYLARQVTITGDARQTLLSISVSTFEPLASKDFPFTPPADATLQDRPMTAEEVMQAGGTASSPVTKRLPEIPQEFSSSPVQGAVLLAYVIGKDGKVGDLEALSSPSQELATASLKWVKDVQFKPFLLRNGQPVDVNAILLVDYRRE